MVKITLSVAAIALLSVPAFATSLKQYERSVAESDLYGRDLFSSEELFAAREDLDDLYGRELYFEEDLVARAPVDIAAIAKGLHALHKAHKHAHAASQFVPQGGNGDNSRREIEDDGLFEREPVDLAAVAKGLHALHKAHKAHHAASELVPQNGGNGDNSRRDLYDEDMFERDFDEFLTREYYDDLD